MAWYDITYKCGHTCRKQLYGKIDSRHEYIEWARDNKLCPECEENLRAEKIRKENENAQRTAQVKGYSGLQGTEKQVTWAVTIRDKVVKCIFEFEKQALQRFADTDASQDLFNRLNIMMDELRKGILSIVKASVFIEQRYKYFSKEDVRTIVRVKVAMQDGLIISDEELDKKIEEYKIARIEKREASNPTRQYMSKREADYYVKRYPELFPQK